MRGHLGVLDVRSFRGADCNHYLMGAQVIERSAISKQAAQKVSGERFNLRKLNELEVRKQYQMSVQTGCCSFGNLIART